MHSLLKFLFSSIIVMWLDVNVHLKLLGTNHFPKYSTLLPNTVLTLQNLFLQKKAFPNPFLSQTVCFSTLYFVSVLSYINYSSPCYNDSVSQEVFPINFSVRI